MRVLFVTPWYPIPESPAAGVFVREHARAAAAFDEIALVHLLPGGTNPPRLVQVERVTHEPFPVIRARYRAVKYAGWLGEFLALDRAVRHLEAGGFTADLIHAHIASGAATSALYSRVTGLPMILSEHWSVYLDADPTPLRGLLAQRSRLAINRAVKVLPVSSTLEVAMRRFAPSADYAVVPNVIDCELFRPATVPPPDRPVRLIAVGLLSPSKDYSTMLRAIRQLLDWDLPVRLEIIGYGECEAQLGEMIEASRLEDHVQLVGYLPKSELAERLRRSHVFVHSSRFETFCATAAEALASGLPVVSTRCGGPEDYLTAETGRLVPVGDPRALADGIRAVVEHLDGFKSDRIAAGARQRFALDVVGEQLHAAYMSVPARVGTTSNGGAG